MAAGCNVANRAPALQEADTSVARQRVGQRHEEKAVVKEFVGWISRHHLGSKCAFAEAWWPQPSNPTVMPAAERKPMVQAAAIAVNPGETPGQGSALRWNKLALLRRGVAICRAGAGHSAIHECTWLRSSSSARKMVTSINEPGSIHEPSRKGATNRSLTTW